LKLVKPLQVEESDVEWKNLPLHNGITMSGKHNKKRVTLSIVRAFNR